VRNPRILALAQKVSLSEDPAMTKRLPMERPARVVITATDGRQWVGQAGVNRGDDAAPYTADELTTKFMDLCGRVWPQAHAQRLLQATHELCAGKGRFADWCALLQQPPEA
jgi:2-methylcitrate dehydratase PrpD